MIKFIKTKDAIIREIAKTYKISNLLTVKDSKNISVAIGRAENHTEITKNTQSDRVYYVLNGTLIVNKIENKAGDVVFVPKGTEYEFGGTFEAVVINSPAFNPQVEIISS